MLGRCEHRGAIDEAEAALVRTVGGDVRSEVPSKDYGLLIDDIRTWQEHQEAGPSITFVS